MSRLERKKTQVKPPKEDAANQKENAYKTTPNVSTLHPVHADPVDC